jgi:hypothetical protein
VWEERYWKVTPTAEVTSVNFAGALGWGGFGKG